MRQVNRREARRPRVLILTPRYPYPVVGGDRLRIYYVCRELAKTCDLSLLSLCETEAELNSPNPSDGVFAQIERIYIPRWQSVLNVILALPTHTPLQVAYYRNRRFKRRAHELLKKTELCIAHLIRTGDMVRTAKTTRVLEMTDAISLNYGRVEAAGSRRNWRSWVYRIEARRLLDYERAVLKDFELVTLVSEVDRDFLLEGRHEERVLVCSNGVDLSRFPYREPVSREPAVVFIGNMTTVQNLDACQYFIDEILPDLRSHGDFRFRIIGRIGYEETQRLAAFAGVEIHANVESIPKAVGNSFAGVAPMRLGAGVQNKVLEYMALGLPTVVSPVGLEGLQAKDGLEILVAASPKMYVNHLLRLWRDSEFSNALALSARSYVEHQHLWVGRLAPMVDAVHRLLDFRTKE